MAVREGLLALLDDGPAYGYQLKSEFESATGGVWPLNVGQVYSTLDRLVRDGLVTAKERDGQRSYRLANPGVQALGEWWETVPADEPPPRDELILKILLAVTRGREHALEVLTNQRAALLSLLQRRRQAVRAQSTRTLASALVEDALVVRAEADLRWLDMCEERLLAETEETA